MNSVANPVQIHGNLSEIHEISENLCGVYLSHFWTEAEIHKKKEGTERSVPRGDKRIRVIRGDKGDKKG